MTLHTVGIVAALLLLFSLFSRRLGETILTAPMFFTASGLALGTFGMEHLQLPTSHEVVKLVAEATLIFVLFSDAAMIDLRRLRTEYRLPTRMLGIGLPLQVILGGLFALVVFPDLSLWQAGLLSAVLAPTDAALGQLVVTSKRVPKKLRQTLSVESGLNDGIALPIVTIFLATCLSIEQSQPTSEWVGFVLRQIVFGVLGGLLVGGIAGRLMRAANQRRMMSEGFTQIAVLATAVLSYVAAHQVEGNGFIAAFVGGMAFGWFTMSGFDHHLLEFAEDEGQLLTSLTFLIFGATLFDTRLLFEPRALLYAIASLTVLRMVPMLLSLSGTGLSTRDKLFLSWFGPRGLASVLFALLIVEASELMNRDLIVNVAFLTVAISIVLHGVTAAPAARQFSMTADGGDNSSSAESRTGR